MRPNQHHQLHIIRFSFIISCSTYSFNSYRIWYIYSTWLVRTFNISTRPKNSSYFMWGWFQLTFWDQQCQKCCSCFQISSCTVQFEHCFKYISFLWQISLVKNTHWTHVSKDLKIVKHTSALSPKFKNKWCLFILSKERECNQNHNNQLGHLIPV